MRRAAMVVLAVGLLAALPRQGAAQSLYGPGGLFLHATAAVPEKGQLTPAVLVLPQHNPDTDTTRVWVSGSLDYGATQDVEVGVTVLKITGPNRPASVGGYAKYRFLREAGARPATAVGFTILGFGGANSQAAFLALRKQVFGGDKGPAAHPVVLNAGVQYAANLDGIPREDLMPYGGIEVGLARNLTFVAEGRPRGTNEFGTPLALTLVYQYGQAGRLALTWANNGRSDSPRIGFGAGFGLGAR